MEALDCLLFLGRGGRGDDGSTHLFAFSLCCFCAIPAKDFMGRQGDITELIYIYICLYVRSICYARTVGGTTGTTQT